MTVAAVVLVPDPGAAFADLEGVPALRRVVQSAWAGGALPVVIVAQVGPEGQAVGAVLEGLPASFVPATGDPGASWFAAGFAAATSQVHETTAALLWPSRYSWADPETVTSLIEASGANPESIVRAAFQGRAGFPMVIPAALVPRFETEPSTHAQDLVEALAAEGVPLRVLELGDPGIVNDASVAHSDMPPYQGPPEPVAGRPPEWNDELARHANAGEAR